MESIRRTEFIVFIINVFDSLNLGRPELHYVDHYDWESPNKKEKIEFKPKDEVMTKTNKRVLNNLNQNNFINASMQGYLLKFKNSLFTKWKPRYFVLSNIGLISFHAPEKNPRKIYSLIGAQVNDIQEEAYTKKYCFKIRGLNYEILLSASSEQQQKKWVRYLINLQNETEKRKDLIFKSNQI